MVKNKNKEVKENRYVKRTGILKYLNSLQALSVFIVMFAIMSLTLPNFLSVINMTNLSKQLAISLIMGIVMTMVIIAGEIDFEMIHFISNKFPIALDAQALMRKVFPDGATEYTDWDDKLEILPLVSYFKVDATEAAILTGFDTETHEGRVSAAEKIVEWGAKESVISHHKELIAVTESGVVFSPLKNRNLLGRTGRGDTSFTTYITERLNKNSADAVKYAAALTSLKMEIPGPFKKTRQDVEAFIRDFY